MIYAPDSEMDFVETEGGLVVPESWVGKRPMAVDLFCGAGGMSLGMIQAGWEVVAAADYDPLCAQTYLYNLGAYPCQFYWIEPEDERRMEKSLEKSLKESSRGGKPFVAFTSGGNNQFGSGVKHFFLGDIAKLKGEDILSAIGMERGELDCVCGGPPCQGFSRSGKQEILDPRNSLVFEFARLVVEINPKTMVFENVPGIVDMVTPDGMPVIDTFCRILEDGGFGTIDRLKRTLAAQPGYSGLLRGKSKHDSGAKKPKKRIKQKELFAGAIA